MAARSPRVGSGLRRINQALFTETGRRRPELTDDAVRNLLYMFNALRVSGGMRPLLPEEVTL